jgi:hypothetical protein
MRRALGVFVICTAVMMLNACARQTSQSDAPAATESSNADKGVPPPANSPLARVKLGMRANEVTDILGAPSDQNSYASGKAWIPFYFGDDVRRTSFYYKGQGRVVFSGGNKWGGGGGNVIRVDYDPSEPGVAR